VRLYATDGSGVPVLPPLATTALPGASITADNTFHNYSVDFAPATAQFLTAGTQYAIGLSTADSAQNSWGAGGNTCPGTLYVFNNSNFVLFGFTSGEDAAYSTFLGPGNDEYARALTLEGASDSDNGTTAGGTLETNEPDHYVTNPPDSDFWVGDHSVWYRWAALGSGPATVDVCTAQIDSILAVYEGDSGTALGDLVRVADNNNGADTGDCPGGTFGSYLEFNAEAGQEYRFAVGDAGGARENTFTLALTGPTNEPPTIKPLAPPPGSKIRKRRPMILAGVLDAASALTAADLELFVDGRRRANFAYNEATGVLSQRSARLKPGRHTVKVEATDGDLDASKTWRFRVKRRRR
jgi:hypothetical protein